MIRNSHRPLVLPFGKFGRYYPCNEIHGILTILTICNATNLYCILFKFRNTTHFILDKYISEMHYITHSMANELYVGFQD